MYPYSANAGQYLPGASADGLNSPLHPATQAFPDRPAAAIKDHGPNPFVINIEAAARQNRTYRTALWTGQHLQVTLMSINPGEDIGLEIHPHTDQFIRIESGRGLVLMGPRQNQLSFRRYVTDGDAFIIPAGTWHDLVNTGAEPVKLYSIYAPPNHPFGTVQQTKAEAAASERTAAPYSQWQPFTDAGWVEKG